MTEPTTETDASLVTDGGTDAQLTRLDCPGCDDAVDARYLGTADTDEHDGHIVGWECTECGAELQEHVDCRGSSFDLQVVDSAVSDEADPDNYRKCPACGDGHAPVERLGQRVRDDDVMVVGWRCLLCETAVSEHIGEGKVSDMLDRQPRVGEPITDGGRVEDDPAHSAVGGGFECECGATRRTPLGISRHRERCTDRSAAVGGDQR